MPCDNTIEGGLWDGPDGFDRLSDVLHVLRLNLLANVHHTGI